MTDYFSQKFPLENTTIPGYAGSELQQLNMYDGGFGSPLFMISMLGSHWITGAIILVLLAVILFLYRKTKKSERLFSAKEKLLKAEHRAKDEEIVKTAHNLEVMQEQLIQSDKMASLGQLTAGIAHEIQNPLNFVNNFSEISMELLDDLQDCTPEERASIINDIKQNLNKIVFHGKRADSIVKGMLKLSRAASNEKQPTDINKLVEEFFVLAYHGMRANDPGFNCIMDKHLSPGLPLVKIFPQDVSRVILNMFNNSFYAVDEKSKLTNKDYKPMVSISTDKINGEIVVTIRDNGKGIPEEIRDKIFTPFFTTKPAGKGTGLGLSISHDIIVTKHHGRLKLDSQPGEFTEFKISLPI